MSSEYRDFLELSYEELEERNLALKEQRKKRVDPAKLQEDRLKDLNETPGIKAVTVMFSDLEGRLHMLDYDKKFLVKSFDNLTFDGSSIRGFTAQRESDLRLGLDWSAFYWAPADIFGAGKVLVFGEVIDKTGKPYSGDVRGLLKTYADEQFKNNGYTLNAANEIEGFLFEGIDAERKYHEIGKFEYTNHGGYYHSLPGDPLRDFIDVCAEVQRAMGFENEKGPPRGGAVAVRDQLHLWRRGRGSRPDPALQTDLPAGSHADGHDGELFAQAGHGRERVGHAHQRVGHGGRQEPDVGSERRGEDLKVRLGLSWIAF